MIIQTRMLIEVSVVKKKKSDIKFPVEIKTLQGIRLEISYAIL